MSNKVPASVQTKLKNLCKEKEIPWSMIGVLMGNVSERWAYSVAHHEIHCGEKTKARIGILNEALEQLGYGMNPLQLPETWYRGKNHGRRPEKKESKNNSKDEGKRFKRLS